MQEVGSGTLGRSRKSSSASLTHLTWWLHGEKCWYLGQKCHVAVTGYIKMKDVNVSVEGTDLGPWFEMYIKDRFKSFFEMTRK